MVVVVFGGDDDSDDGGDALWDGVGDVVRLSLVVIVVLV